jgi:hypothetical protein
MAKFFWTSSGYVPILELVKIHNTRSLSRAGFELGPSQQEIQGFTDCPLYQLSQGAYLVVIIYVTTIFNLVHNKTG